MSSRGPGVFSRLQSVSASDARLQFATFNVACGDTLTIAREPAMSRIAPLEPPYTADIQQQFDRIMRGAPPLTLFRVIAGNARAWEKFRAGSLLDRGPLSLREREIVIDRTCALTGCEYEWGVHVRAFGDAAGLTDQQVRATVLGAAAASCWSAAEQALITVVDALHFRATLDDTEF